MNVNERFKRLRKACDKSQKEFGKILGLSVSGVSDIERGKRNVTEQHLIMLSNWKERKINVDWLRTGEGDMFIKLPPQDEIGYFVVELLDYSDNPLYDLIIDMMKTYHELDEKSQTVIREYFRKLKNAHKDEKEEG